VTYGAYGSTQSSAGTGVYGSAVATSGTTHGGRFEVNSPEGAGVYGVSHATSGLSWGGYFESASSEGRAVQGLITATTALGFSDAGYFYNLAPYGTGVFGSGDDCGVCGSSAGTGTYGVFGTNTNQGTGVYGYGYQSGVRGYSVWGDGVSGESTVANKSGVYALNTNGTQVAYGLYGRSDSPSGYGVWYSGGIGGTALIQTVVKTSQGPTSLDAVTAAGCWIEDFGEGRLVNGRCHVDLDPVFLETVTIDTAHPIKVFVQLNGGDCSGVAVNKGTTGFDVVELNNGVSNGTFDYRVVAKRKGFEARRLDVCEAGRSDPYLYPELREKELEQREALGERREAERQGRELQREVVNRRQ
jgi:hypothetical protein